MRSPEINDWGHLESLARVGSTRAQDSKEDGEPVHVMTVPGPLPPAPERSTLHSTGSTESLESSGQFRQIEGADPGIAVDPSGLDSEFYEPRITTEEK